jgi:hypothetical protein
MRSADGGAEAAGPASTMYARVHAGASVDGCRHPDGRKYAANAAENGIAKTEGGRYEIAITSSSAVGVVQA